MQNWIIPHAAMMGQHPIYLFEVQTKRRRRTLQMIPRTSLIWFGFIAAIMTALWLFAIWQAMRASSYSYYYDPAYNASQQALGWFFFVGLAAGLLIDVVGVLVSVGSINRQRTTGHWDLLLLTTMNAHQVMQAKHVVTQVQAWRIFTVVFSLRLTTVLLFLVQAFFFEHTWDNQTMLEDFLEYATGEPVHALLLLILAGLFFGCYLIEPFWRLRTVTALGMWVSARINRVTSALLGGFALIPFIWLSQGFVLYILYRVMVTSADSLNTFSYSESRIILFILFWTFVFVMTVYFYYYALRRLGLHRATENAFNPT